MMVTSPETRPELLPLTGPSGAAKRTRHPDCPLPPSLVVSNIALTSVASTYRLRGEQFAGTFSAGFLSSGYRLDRAALLRRHHQLSQAIPHIHFSHQHSHQ